MRMAQFLMGAVVAAGTLAPVAGFATLDPVNEGRRAWLKYNCYGCHGNNAAGGMGPNIQGAEAGDVGEAMNGDATEGGMRSFSGIATSTDAANIAAYLQSIGTPQEPTWLDWWNPVPGKAK
jgi:mono/diheme cytochrome c family protein